MIKYLFGLLLFVSFSSWSVSFVAESKINLCGDSSRVVYSEASFCEEKEGEKCFIDPVVIHKDCGIYKSKNLYGDIKFDEESCEGESSCEELLIAKVCGVGRYPLINESFSEVYCVEVIGKEFAVDPVLKAQSDYRKGVEANVALLKSNGRAAREACLAVLDIISGFNLSNPSGSQAATQMLDSFSVAYTHLSRYEPGKAKHAIKQILVDGVLITQQMKDLALAQLKDYEEVIP